VNDKSSDTNFDSINISSSSFFKGNGESIFSLALELVGTCSSQWLDFLFSINEFNSCLM